MISAVPFPCVGCAGGAVGQKGGKACRRFFDIQMAKAIDIHNPPPEIIETIETMWESTRQEYLEMVETVVREVVAEILGEGMVRE